MPISSPPARPPLAEQIKRRVFGAPRNLEDQSLFHRLSLIPILAWVGLGADGLSSSSYGPEEMFRTVGRHAYLGLILAAATTLTVFVISYAYSRVIEHFPHGGGGYVVTTKLLGPRAGVVSGSALLVDYVLTITVSIAAAGDALFSFLPASGQGWKISLEFLCILFLIFLNLRGVRESVLALTPIFVLFVLTHLVLIVGGIIAQAPALPATLDTARQGYAHGLASLGWGGMVLLLLRAYSFGGGTFTGIEAVSNGLPILREPQVENGKRTMLYMAASLAFTASGLVVCYLLWNVSAAPDKTMNAVLAENFVRVVPLGRVFVILTLASEGALLIVAGQTGFVDGPRVLANMAIDSWLPSRFASLGERLTIRNGILVMGLTALAALLYTHGDVRQIVVMYSLNVFLTFSLTEFSMCRFWLQERRRQPTWKRKISVHLTGLTMCLTIFIITVLEKFREGGWLTLTVTALLIATCFVVKRHYRRVGALLAKLYAELENIAPDAKPNREPVDPQLPTAAVLVGSYGGIGIHTLMNVFRIFPNHFKNLVFVSVGVIDSGVFKGGESVGQLKQETQKTVDRYVALARGLGVPATAFFAIGTDAVAEAEKLCLQVAEKFPKATFFAGKLIFARERWYHRLLHNRTAFAVEQRLQEAGQTMVIIPAKVA
jgi:amino acid transporter